MDESKEVQKKYSEIADYINFKAYTNAKKFLAGADGWLIAHALVAQGIVVSQETGAGKGRDAKIPDIGKKFNVDVIRRLQWLKDCNVQLVLKKKS